MAEHKIEDTMPPLARRAARPFVGPAGGAAPARPVLRPTGPTGRPSSAPFAPPLAAPRTSLGRMANGPSAAPAADAGASDATKSRAVAPVERLELSEASSLEPLSRRPITSEMVALDAVAAFDAVWGGSMTPAASPVVEPVSSLVDEASLGSGAGADGRWAEDDITATDVDATHAVVEPSRPAAGAEHHAAPSSTIDVTWPTVATPDCAMPPWLADDNDPTAPSAPPEPSPDLVVAEPIDVAADQRVEAVGTRVAHSLRVSAALDRLAERVRGGEIDVSSVAPEAPDAAVLASVLAALLGGSSSR